MMNSNQPPPDLEQTKFYFPNLDGLRFLSFLLVFLTHSFSVIYPAIDHHIWYNKLLMRMFSAGEIGVSFFFVLSGFLITFLLLKEKKNTQKISVTSFYIRRALRIWPLYYLIILSGYLLFPLLRQKLGLPALSSPNPYYCLTFLNNFYKIYHHDVPLFMDVFWSVAIEEQFYLIWPLLIYFIPVRFYFHLFVLIIVISTLFRSLFMNHLAVDFHTLGVITDLTMGGLAAFLAIHTNKFNQIMRSIPLWSIVFSYILLLMMIAFGEILFSIPILHALKRLIMATLFAFIIMEQNYAMSSPFKIGQWKWITTMGKFTYGLYCYHAICIMAISTIFKLSSVALHGWLLFAVQSFISFALCVIISRLSYRFFESYFLKLKTHFSARY